MTTQEVVEELERLRDDYNETLLDRFDPQTSRTHKALTIAIHVMKEGISP